MKISRMNIVISVGVVKVEPSMGRMVVELTPDILDYYGWFLTKQYWIKLHKPLYGSHITIASSKHHKDIPWDEAIKYEGELVEFQYDVDIIRGGNTKGFIMFYMKVFSERLETIKKELNIIESPTYKGLHLTLGTVDKGQSKARLYWPEMITIS